MDSREGSRETQRADFDTANAGGVSGSAGGDRPFFRVAILLFLVVFLYALRNELSPVLVGTTLVVLVSALLFLAWILSELAGLLWPFVASFALAYLLAPLVGILERRISRTLAIAILALLVLGGLFGIGILVVPMLISEVGELVGRLPGYGRLRLG